jgi:redox-sensitive bicupin YhaK (pirin superfamily)
MPGEDLRRQGGRMHGFPLWVNLPKRDKMMKPRYQEIPSARIPAARSADGLVSVRVIAGEALGAKAVIETRTPIQYLHYTIQPGGRTSQPVPRGYNAFAYVIEGAATLGSGSSPASARQMATFADDGDEVTIAAPATSERPLEVLLIAGLPLREPVARYGPFVMNTRAELLQAVDDFQNGRMGRIGG